tara:strand:- start:4064 stop:6004 length:1941 start_codon:yes stop_codon:yes gene_type:complete
MPNLLKKEKSPYLKQHEDNPVDWYAWNKETLLKAKEEKKPIFLSVGYASCHWCHVMAHESFEDQETAKLMNEKFINIKVDREERPDLDYVFQKSLSILTGTQGGWPLSMFLDENGVPFTGGTYFPPKEMQGRPDFKKVLNNVSSVYKENREKIIAQAPQMQDIFSQINQRSAVLSQPLEPFVEKIISYLDEEYGSFKGAPKFPQFYMFDAILYFYLKTNNQKYLTPVEKLLSNISSKGVYDQLAGGIARYAVDEKWVIPHFEKMLYDNIQYIGLLTKFYQKTKKEYFKKKLIQTIKFINKEFKNEENLYGSAYDADSEGVEGKYYVWSYEELEKLLENDLKLFEKKYEISSAGNFEGKNILVESKNELNEGEQTKITQIEEKLIQERSKRVRPFFDDKSQTDLNAFILDTLIGSAIVLGDNNLKNEAMSTLEILNKKLSNKIYHCYDSTEIDAFLEDYVYYAMLLVTLYEVNGDEKSLEKAINIMKEIWEIFYNKDTQLLQKNKIKDNDLFVSPIDLNDSNIPNGNSVYLNLCNKIYTITNDKFWFDKVEILKKSFHQVLNSFFSQMFSFIKVLDLCENSISFTFFGNQDSIKDIKINLQKDYLGRATFVYKNNNEEGSVVICKNQTCSEKLKSFDQVKNFLENNI